MLIVSTEVLISSISWHWAQCLLCLIGSTMTTKITPTLPGVLYFVWLIDIRQDINYWDSFKVCYWWFIIIVKYKPPSQQIDQYKFASESFERRVLDLQQDLRKKDEELNILKEKLKKSNLAFILGPKTIAIGWYLCRAKVSVGVTCSPVC